MDDYEARIAAIRRSAHRRRAEAWAMVPETVLGMELNPITPAIYSLLVGTGNAFVCGKIPEEHDLRNFVWFCSPQFDADNPRQSLQWKAVQMFRLRRALRSGTTWRLRKTGIMANFYRACIEINEIVDATFKDEGLQSDEAQPLAASLEAQFVDVFSSAYTSWNLPRPVRHTPIKQLYQMARCIERRNAGSAAKYYDKDENRATAAFLAEVNSRN